MKVEGQFGKVAERYVESRSHREGRSLARMLELVPPQKDWRVLDVATGGGHAALAYAPGVREVVALDCTPEMLAAAREFVRRRLTEEARGGTVTFREGRVEALPFQDGEFNLVICRTAAHHFTDILSAVAEMARVIVPGGRVMVVDLMGHEAMDLQEFVQRIEVLHDPTHRRSYTVAEWKEFFTAAALQIETVEAPFTELPDGTRLADWLARSETDPGREGEIRRLLLTAPTSIREALDIRQDGDDLLLRIWKLLLVGVKPAGMQER